MKHRNRTNRRTRVKHRVLAALLALAAAACQQDREDAEGFSAQERDSAGVRIVENQRPPEGSRLGWRIGPEPAASIGVLEGEKPYMLHGAVAATRLPDGRIVVANQGSSELRVFDALGTHLATWGGPGEGPGEFGNLRHVAPWPGDSIVAWYSQGFGLSVFDSNGNFGRSFFWRFDGDDPGPGLRPWALAARPNGTILTERGYVGSFTLDTVVVELWDGEGALSASFGKHGGMEVIITDPGTDVPEYAFVAFGRRLATALWGDLIVASSTARYEIRAFRDDGALARIVRRDHLSRAPTEADRGFHVERELSSVTEPMSQDSEDYLRRRLESAPLAKVFPAFSSVKGDAAGNLWVREYVLPGEEGPAPLWTVFDSGGRVLGFVETPGGLDILEIGEDHLLGRSTDDLGVESIQVWPLERSGG